MHPAESVETEGAPQSQPGDMREDTWLGRSSRAALGTKGGLGISILLISLSLAFFTVLSTLAIPMFYERPVVTLDNASTLMASDLRYAQNEAAISGLGTSVHFDVAGDGYRVEYESCSPVANPIGGGPLQREFSIDAIFEGVSMQPVEGTTFDPVHFDANGFCLDSGAYRIDYRGEHRIVRLEAGSGLIQIDGLTNGWRDEGL